MNDQQAVATGAFLQAVWARWRKRALLFAVDLTAAALAFNAALAMRLWPSLPDGGDAARGTAAAVLLAAAVFPSLGLYRRHWRYASVSDLIEIVKAAVWWTLAFSVAVAVVPLLAGVPRSVPAIAIFILVAVLSGIRLAFRRRESRALVRTGSYAVSHRMPILLVGAGDAADNYLRAIRSDPDSPYEPVGCLDAGGDSRGLLLRNVPVLGTPDEFLAAWQTLRRQGRAPRRLVFTERPQAIGADRVERLMAQAERLGVAVSRVASPTELRRANEAGAELRPIDVTDLLARPQAALDREAVAGLVRGRRVLVTGAGGSIGSELSRQIASLDPAVLILADASEYNLYAIDLDCQERFRDVPRIPCLCNVRDAGRVDEIFETYKPEIVFHAAALKHVPMVEMNPCEGVLTNVVGTRNVAAAAARVGVAAMVQISTDKVVNPTSVMGATKRIAELYCQALDLEGGAAGCSTRFMTVRFGNVLGSSGSLIPLFQRQLERGGPLTVTDPEMTRFFMTIREAVELTLHASASGLAHGLARGEIAVLEMGEPVRIIDIARRMIRLAGFRPDRDVKIEIIGRRPGEKLFEELFDDSETRVPSAVPGVLGAIPVPIPLADIEREIARLERYAASGERARVIASIASILPTYVPQPQPPAAVVAPAAVAPAAVAPAAAPYFRPIVPMAEAAE